MDDIRSRHYKLNAVMLDGELPPKVAKKDAHDIVLEFIRSRPPLKPVSIGGAIREISLPNCLLSAVILLESPAPCAPHRIPPDSNLLPAIRSTLRLNLFSEIEERDCALSF